jgi:hypothetical protein
MTTKLLTLQDLKLAAHKIGATVEYNRDGVEVFPPDNHEWCGGTHSYVVLLVDTNDGRTPLDRVGKSEAYRDAIDRISYGYALCDPDCEGLLR